MTKLPAVAVLAVVALAACNDSHVVAGARCSSGATEAPAQRVRPTPSAQTHIASAASSAPDAVPATAANLLDAMEVTSALAAENITASAISLTDIPRQAAAFQGLGSLQPLSGPSFAWISTGVAGAGTAKPLVATAWSTQDDATSSDVGGSGCSGITGSDDCATLAFTFVAPADAQAISFDFDFMSSEYPEWLGSVYDDSFVVSLTSSNPAHSFANIVYDGSGSPIDINNLYFPQPSAQLGGTGFNITDFFGGCDAGATGILTTTAPVTPGETITLKFRIYDYSDALLDSAVMIDNFRFGATPVGTPTTGTPTPTPGVSPTPTATPANSPTPTPASSPTPEPTPACTN